VKRAETTGPGELSVVIDRTPDRKLSPNSNAHRRTREPYKEDLRNTAALRTGETLRDRAWSWPGPIVIHVVIAWERGRRESDWDNAIAMSKAAIDGVFSKLDADDRQVRGAYLRQLRDREGAGYMEITVTPMIDDAKERAA